MKKYPYIFATIIATLLAIVVWLCTPKEYTAVTKVSDEYKETDLAIGMTQMKAHLRNLVNNGNLGINNMEVYCKILKTEDFARSISNKQVAGRGITYGQYLGKKDTIEAVLDCINYNYVRKQETLTVSFTDRDPLVASQMLDSVMANLQDIVTDVRHRIAEASLKNALQEQAETYSAYIDAQKKYAHFSDSHNESSTQAEQREEDALRNEVKMAYNTYKTATENRVRYEALKKRAYHSFAVIKANTTPQTPRPPLLAYLLSFITTILIITRGVIKYLEFRQKKQRSRMDWGELFSPWSITIGIWALILGLYYLLETKLYPITSQFYICLAIWLPIFCICSLSAYWLTSSQSHISDSSRGYSINNSVFTFFFAISVIITPLYVYRIYQIISMFDINDMMNNVRILALFGDGQGFLNYSSVINQSLFLVALWAYPRVPLWQIVVLAIACLMNGLAIMEKGTLFFVFISIIFVLFERKVIKVRSIVVSGLLVIGLFYLFNLGRAGEDSDYQKNETLLDFFAMYALSPPVAFCQLLPEVTPQFGTNTFGIVYLFLERFGVQDIVVKSKLQEFVFVPVATNVYTLFQPFYIDFGYKGIAFFAMLYGVVTGWLYRLYRNGNSTGCCLYTFLVQVLVLQFYQENIFLSLVFVIQLAFFVTLFTQNKIQLSFKSPNSLCQKTA